MDVLDEAASAYNRGRLVPFIGSGMSFPVCRDWPGMVTALEESAGGGSLQGEGTDDLALANRAARALERLRRGRRISTGDNVRSALLTGGPGAPPPNTVALAALQWPLVLTTNYDDLYVAAVHQQELDSPLAAHRKLAQLERRTSPVRIVGRSAADCHRVLCALSHVAPPLLWALQGYLGGQATVEVPGEQRPRTYRGWAVPYGAGSIPDAGPGPDPAGPDGGPTPDRDLADQVVVGHADYRRVAMRSEGFRRAFAEVFRQRSLLFVGSGLTDRYLLDLFSQIVELYGPSVHPHFAIAPRREFERSFLRRNYGIWLYDDMDTWDDLPAVMDRLRSDRPRARRYEFHARTDAGGAGRLVVDASALEPAPDPRGCIVLSGGGSGRQPLLSNRWLRYLVDAGHLERMPDRRQRTEGRLFDAIPGRRFLWTPHRPARDPEAPLVLIARARFDQTSADAIHVNPVSEKTRQARSRPGQDNPGRMWRDVRLTTFALAEALTEAHEQGRTRVLATLLASGTLRTVAPSHTLLEMVRSWSRHPLRDELELIVHVIDRSVRYDLESRRLDIGRLLPTLPGEHDDRPIQFWLEIGSGPDPERVMIMDLPERSVRTLLGDYGIGGPGWELTTDPVPCLGWLGWTLEEITRWEKAAGTPLSLERIGVLHGSTVRMATTGPR